MKNPFSLIASAFTWLGTELAKVVEWVPKVVTLTDDVEQDAKTLLPQVVTLFEDVDTLAIAAVKDSGAAITEAEALTAAIVAAAKADGVNIMEDEAVLAAFKAFIGTVTASTTWTDLLEAVQKLATDYDTFGSACKAAIAKIEADA